MISDTQAEDAIQSLIDNAEGDAQAKAQRVFLEESRKSLKSEIMREDLSEPVSAQEARAYADPRYKVHLEGLREAVYRDEKAKIKRVAAQALIDAWRTQQANMRVV